MINAERLLGGLLREGLGGRSRRGRRKGTFTGSVSGGLAGTLGLGVLGVAMAAYDHYTDKKSPSAPEVPKGPPPPAAGPPPPPGAAPSGPPPPPMAGKGGGGRGDRDALLLVRAMVAAAAADGSIDEEERRSIFSRLHAGGLTEEEKTFIAGELSSPPGMEDIVSEVKNRELAAQVYAVSLLAVTIDTEEEKAYLARLKERLALSEAEASSIEDELGL